MRRCVLRPVCLTGPGAWSEKAGNRPQPGGRRRRAADDCLGAAKPPVRGRAQRRTTKESSAAHPQGPDGALLGLVTTRLWQTRHQRHMSQRAGFGAPGVDPAVVTHIVRIFGSVVGDSSGCVQGLNEGKTLPHRDLRAGSPLQSIQPSGAAFGPSCSLMDRIVARTSSVLSAGRSSGASSRFGWQVCACWG